MKSRRRRALRTVGRRHASFSVLVALIGVNAAAQIARAEQKIVKWAVEATVVEAVDPGGFFPDVRVGDPVRGWISYDRGNDAQAELSSDGVAIYQNVTGYHGVSMVIENPRSGVDVEFVRDDRLTSGGGALINLGNDYVDDEDGVVDWVWVDQSVLPPPGYPHNLFDIAVFLYGQSEVLSDLSLPEQLSLDDWPLAIIQFKSQFFDLDPLATFIGAEIFSLTPVAVVPGDYDSNGVVDGNDFVVWELGFVTDWPGIRNGDGDGNGVVDGSDFLVWQRHIGNGSSSATAQIPEPATLLLYTIAAAGIHRLIGRMRQELFRASHL